MKFFSSIGSVAVLAFTLSARAVPPMFDPQQLEFFETKVRPLLVEHCYKCHSTEANKSKGGLMLDSRDGLLKGGDSGPAIVPGNPEKSLLVKAISYTDEDLEMPPEKEGGKLSPEKIAVIEQWIKNGAVDPRLAKPGQKLGDMEVAFAKAKTHWAFQPVVKPAVPKAKKPFFGKAEVLTPVDSFIRAKLDEKKLKPAEPADRRTLIRRAYFDLTGLPPTPEQVTAFVNDKSPDAFAKVVDSLLASPRYGERWGRFWLDIARYADTKGYVFQEERRYPFAYTYRDYVIRAFNEDKPYDQFLIEQIAADAVATGEDKSALAAMGFLTVGRRFLNNQNDIIDDRMDATIRGTMALTVACARCHDHKFDPIPTKDYYSLHGIFASSEEPKELPLLGKTPDSPKYQEYLKKKAEVQAKIDAKTTEAVRAHRVAAFKVTGDYLLGARDSKSRLKDETVEAFAKSRRLEPKFLEGWIKLLGDKDAASDPLFGPWIALAKLSDKDFATNAAAALTGVLPTANPALLAELAKKKPTALKDVVATYNTVFGGPDSNSIPAVVEFKKAPRAPQNISDDEVEKLIKRKISNDTEGLRKELAAVDWEHPGAPARGMAMVDKDKPHNSKVFIRGNAGSPGPEAPRRFLTAVAGTNAPAFTKGSGRLELAQSIAAKDNPLTARVFVNRVWGWHFGTPLVRTPGDFGVRTDAPVHLALLDYLAASFVENGWSVKQLHRQIMLTSTYQQSSVGDAKAEKADPENLLIHKFNRQRLDFESMRDTLLATSGKLDTTAGGLPVDIVKEPFSPRRSVYGYIDRQNLPGLFRTFDFANPDTTSPQRNVTTVPQQALFLMNSPFVIQQARALVKRAEIASVTNDDARAAAMFATVYQRAPDKTELKVVRGFVERNSAPQPRAAITPGWHYGFGWYNPLANLIKDYQAMTNFAQGRMIPGAKFPLSDERGHVSLTDGGGHPGDTPKVASILRWVSPADGMIQIEAELSHAGKAGDGVRGRIVTGRGGKIGEWMVHTNKMQTDFAKIEVKLGESVDFVVDCVTGPNSDGYNWAPLITLTPDEKDPALLVTWDARKDFNKPAPDPDPLTAWEQLAQVLLLSNELLFVD